MSASPTTPAYPTQPAAGDRRWTGTHDPLSTSGRRGGPRQEPVSPLAASVMASLTRSGKWAQWQAAEPRLAGFASLEQALEGWRRRDERCYQVVAGLTSLGSRRGGGDDDAALAVVVLLEDGIARVAAKLSDVCEIDDLNATVWEEVKAAEPQLGRHAARYLLQRAHQRLTRPSAGMVSRVQTTSLDQRLGWHADTTEGADRAGHDDDLVVALPGIEDPVEDLADLLTWASKAGVIATAEIDLLVDLLAADHEGTPRQDAQRLAGERRGVGPRTVRRRRDATVSRLREAAPRYLAATG